MTEPFRAVLDRLWRSAEGVWQHVDVAGPTDEDGQRTQRTDTFMAIRVEVDDFEAIGALLGYQACPTCGGCGGCGECARCDERQQPDDRPCERCGGAQVIQVLEARDVPDVEPVVLTSQDMRTGALLAFGAICAAAAEEPESGWPFIRDVLQPIVFGNHRGPLPVTDPSA